MDVEKAEESKKILSGLLERESLYREIVQELRARLLGVFDQPETIGKLAEEMAEYEADIVKRYFFPIDDTIKTFMSESPTAKGEMVKDIGKDKEKLLQFIDSIERACVSKEEEMKELKEESRKFREMLVNTE
jgi:hypothetical protein